MIPTKILLIVVRFSPKLDNSVWQDLSRNLDNLQIVVKLIDVVAT